MRGKLHLHPVFAHRPSIPLRAMSSSPVPSSEAHCSGPFGSFRPGAWADAMAAWGEEQAGENLTTRVSKGVLENVTVKYDLKDDLDSDFQASSGGRCTPVRDPLPEPESSPSGDEASSVHVPKPGVALTTQTALHDVLPHATAHASSFLPTGPARAFPCAVFAQGPRIAPPLPRVPE